VSPPGCCRHGSVGALSRRQVTGLRSCASRARALSVIKGFGPTSRPMGRHRRAVLATATALATAGLAGCSGDNDGTGATTVTADGVSGETDGTATSGDATTPGTASATAELDLREANVVGVMLEGREGTLTGPGRRVVRAGRLPVNRQQKNPPGSKTGSSRRQRPRAPTRGESWCPNTREGVRSVLGRRASDSEIRQGAHHAADTPSRGNRSSLRATASTVATPELGVRAHTPDC